MEKNVSAVPTINPANNKKVYTHACMQKHSNASINL